MKKEDLYLEIRCKCCNKATKKICVGNTSEENFKVSGVIHNLYTENCIKCKKLTVWEVIAWLGLDK